MQSSRAVAGADALSRYLTPRLATWGNQQHGFIIARLVKATAAHNGGCSVWRQEKLRHR
jgi:hypothetical protein